MGKNTVHSPTEHEIAGMKTSDDIVDNDSKPEVYIKTQT